MATSSQTRIVHGSPRLQPIKRLRQGASKNIKDEIISVRIVTGGGNHSTAEYFTKREPLKLNNKEKFPESLNKNESYHFSLMKHSDNV
jgi:hypothetical protein